MTMSVGVKPEQQQQAVSKDLKQVFMDHYDLVYRTAYRVTGNGNDAEDVLQTLFLRLARRASSLDLKADWPPYLRRAAVNVSLDLVVLSTRYGPLLIA